MACMEHRCTQCDWFEMDNESHKICPKCGAKVISYFDEQNDYDREAYESRHGLEDEEQNAYERGEV